MAATNQTILTLSDLTADVDQFVQQFQTWLQTRPSWVGTLTTMTSETLIELAASVGAFAQGRIIRAAEDAFAETAQSDSAVLNITQMQGLRISRSLPAGMTGTLSSPVPTTLPPLTQFRCGGFFFFNRDQITFTDTNPVSVTLFEGQVFSPSMQGLGTERQTYVAPQDQFVISDQDVIVQINGEIIPKAYGGLWNFDGLPGISDQTLSDGRLLVQFGNLGGLNGNFGSIPGVNDLVVISYPVTQGATGNSFTTINKPITVDGAAAGSVQQLITGVATANPTGGSNENPIISYKNVASGGFGTYQSAVTKSQYQSIIATYPGIVDVVTQAQREIDPSDPKWMNVIRVSGLTTSPWTSQQINDFISFCQKVTMYSTQFLWQDPIPIPRDVALDVFAFNSAPLDQIKQNVTAAIQALFAPRPGLLTTNFYISDLVNAAMESSPGGISYIIPREPTGAMIVGAPQSPQATFIVNQRDANGNIITPGTLPELVYGYGISTDLVDGDVGFPSSWVYPQVKHTDAPASITLNWPPVSFASQYHIWGRNSSQGFGLLATVPATQLTFTDTGAITPTGTLPSSAAFPIRYNTLKSLTINVFYAERQQRIDTNPTRLQIG